MAYSGGAASAAAPGNKGLKGIIAGEKSQLVKLDAFFFFIYFHGINSINNSGEFLCCHCSEKSLHLTKRSLPV